MAEGHGKDSRQAGKAKEDNGYGRKGNRQDNWQKAEYNRKGSKKGGTNRNKWEHRLKTEK